MLLILHGNYAAYLMCNVYGVYYNLLLALSYLRLLEFDEEYQHVIYCGILFLKKFSLVNPSFIDFPRVYVCVWECVQGRWFIEDVQGWTTIDFGRRGGGSLWKRPEGRGLIFFCLPVSGLMLRGRVNRESLSKKRGSMSSTGQNKRFSFI